MDWKLYMESMNTLKLYMETIYTLKLCMETTHWNYVYLETMYGNYTLKLYKESIPGNNSIMVWQWMPGKMESRVTHQALNIHDRDAFNGWQPSR